MFQSVSLDHNKAEVQDSRVEEFPWGLSVILSILCKNELYGENLGV